MRVSATMLRQSHWSPDSEPSASSLTVMTASLNPLKKHSRVSYSQRSGRQERQPCFLTLVPSGTGARRRQRERERESTQRVVVSGREEAHHAVFRIKDTQSHSQQGIVSHCFYVYKSPKLTKRTTKGKHPLLLFSHQDAELLSDRQSRGEMQGHQANGDPHLRVRPEAFTDPRQIKSRT